MHLVLVPVNFYFLLIVWGNLEPEEMNGVWSILTRLSGRPEKQKELTFRV